ncbi:MAG: SPASM domain-containing protein [Proteobacteria bacterium]|nr:SPASM domain-containing protein [Pseudomonadota bacterium]
MSEPQIGYRSNTYYEFANPEAMNWRDFRSPAYEEYRRKWDTYPLRRYAGDFPLHVDLDTTNACNLKCLPCPRTHYLATGNTNWSPEGRIGYMHFDLFRRVIDQAAEGGAFSIKINYLGEPLLHPQVVDQVSYASGRGLEVMMNTNATLLTEEMSTRLLEAGLDDLFFSVDSPYAPEYESIRIGARFDRVIRNIERFVQIKERLGLRHVQTRASMIVSEDRRRDRQTIEAFKSLFTSLGVAEIGFGLLTDMKTDYGSAYGIVPDFLCRDIYTRMFVFWDGPIGPCCGEWERGYVLGDALRDDLGDVWNNPRYQALRQAHDQGRYDRIPICRACSVPWLSTREVEA